MVGDVILFGNGENLSTSLKNCITSAGREILDTESVKCYKSCKYLSEKFTIFKKNVKCMESVFKTEDEKFGNIIHIIKIDEIVYVLAQMFKSEKKFFWLTT